MWDDLSDLMLGWKIILNPYSGMLQVSDTRILDISDDELDSDYIGKALLLYDKGDHTPMMVQFDNVYDCLGDIEDMPQDQVVDKIIKYLQSHK
jgi:hypothetical protein